MVWHIYICCALDLHEDFINIGFASACEATALVNRCLAEGRDITVADLHTISDEVDWPSLVDRGSLSLKKPNIDKFHCFSAYFEVLEDILSRQEKHVQKLVQDLRSKDLYTKIGYIQSNIELTAARLRLMASCYLDGEVKKDPSCYLDGQVNKDPTATVAEDPTSAPSPDDSLSSELDLSADSSQAINAEPKSLGCLEDLPFTSDGFLQDSKTVGESLDSHTRKEDGVEMVATPNNMIGFSQPYSSSSLSGTFRLQSLENFRTDVAETIMVTSQALYTKPTVDNLSPEFGNTVVVTENSPLIGEESVMCMVGGSKVNEMEPNSHWCVGNLPFTCEGIQQENGGPRVGNEVLDFYSRVGGGQQLRLPPSVFVDPFNDEWFWMGNIDIFWADSDSTISQFLQPRFQHSLAWVEIQYVPHALELNTRLLSPRLRRMEVFGLPQCQIPPDLAHRLRALDFDRGNLPCDPDKGVT